MTTKRTMGQCMCLAGNPPFSAGPHLPDCPALYPLQRQPGDEKDALTRLVAHIRKAHGVDEWTAVALDLISEAREEQTRLRQERFDALNARTTEGLSAAEWQLRTGKAERERDQARTSEAVWRKRLEAAAEELADVGAGECGRLDIVTRVRMLKAQLAALSVDMAKVVGEPTTTDCPSTEACAVCGTASGFPCNPRVRRHLRECGDPSRCALVTRYPCSPTCTHDDAATPGHAERVKERSEAFRKTCTGGRECSPGCDAHGVGPRNDIEARLRNLDTYARGHEEGADAMRAACLIALAEVMEAEGYSDAGPGTVHGRLKAAIEGAVP